MHETGDEDAEEEKVVHREYLPTGMWSVRLFFLSRRMKLRHSSYVKSVETAGYNHDEVERQIGPSVLVEIKASR